MENFFAQVKELENNLVLIPTEEQENPDVLKTYKPNQVIKCETTGIRDVRSYQQLKFWWACCSYAVNQLGVYQLDNRRKVSDYILLKTGCVDYFVIVDGVSIMKPISISYDNLKQIKANKVFTKGLNLLAELMNTTLDELKEELVRLGKIKRHELET